ncbi:unnamed protein product [Cuscuta epithymum]|uniref:Uncharacterized protein n=1 Tax=Cuscuta epithymum TaxID=186058 RepID=A0AAV0CSP1_9ASTE|nr:unnamed protein product [Cuscuta epithymum]
MTVLFWNFQTNCFSSILGTFPYIIHYTYMIFQCSKLKISYKYTCANIKFKHKKWLDVFGNASAESLEGAPNDHLALFIKLVPTPRVNQRQKFKFKNVWLREDDCRDIVARSWGLGRDGGILRQVTVCGKAVGDWGRDRIGSFGKHIGFCKKRLDFLRRRSDDWGLIEFQRVRREYLDLLEKENQFWRHRAKEFWL